MLKGILKGIFWVALLVGLGGVGGAAGLYVFRGGEGVFLPQVTGFDVVRALELLGEKGIPMQVSRRVFSDAVAMNHVVRQNPPGGRRIRKGRIVSLVLSKGPRDVAVPAVVGKNLNRAETLIRLEGLRLRLVERLYDPKRPIDQVLGVWPNEGENIRRGEGVVLVVSQGSRERAYVMPSLIGEPVNNALDKVRALGLTVGASATWIAPAPSGAPSFFKYRRRGGASWRATGCMWTWRVARTRLRGISSSCATACRTENPGARFAWKWNRTARRVRNSPAR